MQLRTQQPASREERKNSVDENGTHRCLKRAAIWVAEVRDLVDRAPPDRVADSQGKKIFLFFELKLA